MLRTFDSDLGYNQITAASHFSEEPFLIISVKQPPQIITQCLILLRKMKKSGWMNGKETEIQSNDSGKSEFSFNRILCDCYLATVKKTSNKKVI